MKAKLLLLAAAIISLAADRRVISHEPWLRKVDGRLYNLEPLIKWIDEKPNLDAYGMRKPRPLPNWFLIGGRVIWSSNNVSILSERRWIPSTSSYVDDFYYVQHWKLKVRREGYDDVRILAYRRGHITDRINGRTLAMELYDFGIDAEPPPRLK